LGGVRLISLKQLTHIDEKLVKNIFQEYKIHNADVLVREDVFVDDIIDAIEGNRKYVKCLYVYNKIDQISIEEINDLSRKVDSCVISCSLGLNYDTLLEKIWEKLELVRVYCKKKGSYPDLEEPIILTRDRNGCSVRGFVETIHKSLLSEFNFAMVWGRSCKFTP